MRTDKATIKDAKITDARIGQKVMFCYQGHHQTFGTVYGTRANRWGVQVRVKMEDFTFEWVSSFTDVGIGAYLLK